MSLPCLTKNSEVGEKSGCEAYVRKKKSGRLRVKTNDIEVKLKFTPKGAHNNYKSLHFVQSCF